MVFDTLLFLSEIDFSGAKPGGRCKRLYWADQQTSELDFIAKRAFNKYVCNAPNQIASASFDKRGDSRSDLTVKIKTFFADS